MARKLKSDKILFLATFLLVCASVVMVYSASAVLALERYRQPYLFLIKQGMWSVLGLAMLAVIMRIDYRTYKQPMLIWTLLVASGLMLVLVLFSAPINGSHRWFGYGSIGGQPSEFSKLAIIIFIAAVLERRMHRIDEMMYALAPIGIVLAVVAGLILIEPDYGSAIAVLVIGGVMVFAAGLPYRYVVGAAIVGFPLLGGILMASPYRLKRLLAFLNPWDDPLGDGFQIIQSLIAISTGGVLGKGLMSGVQKLFYLPEPHTDFIYSVIAEEVGFMGATAIVVCFAVITWRGLRIAARAPDQFGAFVAVGLTTMIAVQAFINISVALGLLPTKGIPLPFVSFGGSSLLISLAGMGILLNVSQHASADG